MKKIFLTLALIIFSVIVSSCDKDEITEEIAPQIEVKNFTITNTLNSGQTMATVKVVSEIKNLGSGSAYVRLTAPGIQSDFTLYRTGGDVFEGSTVVYASDFSESEVTITGKLFINGSPTSYGGTTTINFSTPPPTGSVQANLSQVFDLNPNSGKVTVNFLNTFTTPILVKLNVQGSLSGLRIIDINLPVSNLGSLDQVISDLVPGEQVSLVLKRDDTTLSSRNFQTVTTSYTNVAHVVGTTGVTTGTINSNVPNFNFSRVSFSSNGKTKFQNIKIKCRVTNSTTQFPWDVLLLVGQPGNNMVVSSSSPWTNVEGWFEVTLPVTTDVVIGNNTLNLFLASKTFNFIPALTLECKIKVIDQQNVSFETSVIQFTTVN